MTHTKYTKNDIPVYEEQQFLNEEQQTIREILNRIRRPILTNFMKLKVEEGNYLFSTNPKWKDKPISERFGFYLEKEEEKWVQIDIPHNLVEKLEIVKGDDITYPLYLTIDISQKKLIRGAYTIDNEEEVFIDKPVSEKNVEKELVRRLEELEKLREQVKELEDLKHEKVNLEEKVNNLEKKVQEEQEKNDRLDEQVWEGIRVKEKLQKESQKLKRNWKGFYEWVYKKFDVHSKVYDPNIKRYTEKVRNEVLLDEYGFEWIPNSSISKTIQQENKLYYIFAALRDNYPELGNEFHGFARPIKIPIYNDSKSFDELCVNKNGGIFEITQTYLYPSEPYRRLFNDWRKDTPLQTTTE